jgi:hypothetical protein
MASETQDKIKFWVFLVAMMLGVSVAVLLIDMTIKAAILEESNALRRVILGVQDDRSAEANPNGTSHDANSSSVVLGKFPAGMETGNVANGSKAEVPPLPRKRRGTRTEPGTPGDSGEIPPGA